MSGAPTGAQGATPRIIIAVLLFIAIVALSLLLPRALPGELSAGQLTAHSILPCRACPAPEQVTAGAIAASAEGWHMNVQFAAPPLNTALSISFAGIPGTLDLQQSGTTWRYTHPVPATLPRLVDVGQRDNRVVFTFPARMRITGFAVSTASGDRFPQSGYAAPTYPEAAHFNATDTVLLLILGASAYFGFQRGVLVEMTDLAVLLLSLIVAAVAYRPLARLLSGTMHSAKAGAIFSSALLFLVVAFGGMMVARRFIGGDRHGVIFADPLVSGALGGIAGFLRQLPVLAMLLTAGIDLAILHWAAASITSSLLGSSLLHAWSTLFAPA